MLSIPVTITSAVLALPPYTKYAPKKDAPPKPPASPCPALLDTSTESGGHGMGPARTFRSMVRPASRLLQGRWASAAGVKAKKVVTIGLLFSPSLSKLHRPRSTFSKSDVAGVCLMSETLAAGACLDQF